MNEDIAADLRMQWPNIVNVIRAGKGETLARLPVIGFICFAEGTCEADAHKTVGSFLNYFFHGLDRPQALNRSDIERLREMSKISFFGTCAVRVGDKELAIALLERAHLGKKRYREVALAFTEAEEALGVVSPETLIARACTYYRVSREELTGHCRHVEIVSARHRLAYMLYVQCRLTLTEIGRRLGNRHHTTILHATQKVRAQLEQGSPTGLRAELRNIIRGW